ncbi:MAG TPA: hypothetical protein VIG42_04605 [Solirubrobacteraceae bacterium]|jgi:hypothetical protein
MYNAPRNAKRTRKTAEGPPGRSAGSQRRVLAAGGLTLILALYLLLASLTMSSTAAASRSCPLGGGGAGCRANTLAVARASEAEAEVESEGEEEAEAQATAEAEEEEESSSRSGSPQRGRSGSPSEPGSGPSHAGRTPIISRLALTTKGVAALKHAKPIASTVEFSFILSAPAKIHVTLVKQTSAHGSKRWTMLPDSFTTSAGKGRGSRTLTGHNTLPAGRYRLTLRPTAGRARSIYLSARR